MTRDPKIFLGGCFGKYRITADGEPSDKGMSNLEICHWFRDRIVELAERKVDIVMTEDPLMQGIDDHVKKSIEECDAAILIFPKRVKCPIQGWTTSQYAISESGYAASRFKYDVEHHLFGFFENGVNRDNLGLAFPRDRVLPIFYRDNMPVVIPALREVVKGIMKSDLNLTDEPEPILLKKLVFVRRDGRVVIQTTHQFRIAKNTNLFRMPHTLWRVRDSLPNIAQMETTEPGDNRNYFICWPTMCGSPQKPLGTLKCINWQTAANGKESGFKAQLTNVNLAPGDFVEYQIEHSYDGAFFDPSYLDVLEHNSTGIRTNGRGPVREAILIVSFERNWSKSERLPALELENSQSGPIVATSKETRFPADRDPKEFWHDNPEGWQPAGDMKPYLENPSPRWEGYIWRRENFSGTAKATWIPARNYHQPGRKKMGRDPATEGENESTAT